MGAGVMAVEAIMAEAKAEGETVRAMRAEGVAAVRVAARAEGGRLAAAMAVAVRVAVGCVGR